MNTTSINFRSNRIRDIIDAYHSQLDGLYNKGEIDVFIEMLCEEYLHWDRTRLLLSKHETIDQSRLLLFHWALEDLKKMRPIQHIVGHCNFCGCKIAVNEKVLIPRPETEEWVMGLIEEPPFAKDNKSAMALDVCTGSGCIAIAIKKHFTNITVRGVDISKEALMVASENAESNKTEIDFVQDDILNMQQRYDTYDIITANPPYILPSERGQMSDNVLLYEPNIALFVEQTSPLLYHERIVRFAKEHLKKDGVLIMEINCGLGRETMEMIEENGLSAKLHKDFLGRERYVRAWRR